MDFNNHIKNTLEQQKVFFDASYNSAIIAQGHAEQMVASFLEQAKIPAEGLEVFKTVITECGKSRETIKQSIDENYDNLQAFFS